MAMEADILVNNYGLPLDFAQRFLQVVKGDLESAIRVIESSEKDMVVLKGKFISSKKMQYGAFILFYNFQTNLPEYMFTVVSSDIGLSRLKMEETWGSFFQGLEKYMAANESDADLSSRIESRVLLKDNIGYLSSFFVDKDNIDMANIKRFILSEMSKVLLDTGIILKIMPEQASLFRCKSLLATSKFGYKIPVKAVLDWIVVLNIKIEPVLAPLGGVDIEKIKIGDEVLAKNQDSREIVNYILNLIDPSSFSTGALFGKVVFSQKSSGTENTMVILEFAPGIYGKFSIGGKVRILIREKGKNDKHQENQLPVQPQAETKDIAFTGIQDSAQDITLSYRDLSDKEVPEKKKFSGILVLLPFLALLAAVLLGLLFWIMS